MTRPTKDRVKWAMQRSIPEEFEYCDDEYGARDTLAAEVLALRDQLDALRAAAERAYDQTLDHALGLAIGASR